MINIKSDIIKDSIGKLANNVRAENIDYENYLELYSGEENIRNVNNINNSIIYGRRGSGKTHLLKALQEKINTSFSEERRYAPYIDLRRIIPILPSENMPPEARAILIFKYIIQELSHQILQNVSAFHGLNEFDNNQHTIQEDKKNRTIDLFKKVYLEFDGERFSKPSTLTVAAEEVNSISATASLSAKPELSGKIANQKKITKTQTETTYISILDITNVLEEILTELNINRIIILLDEWSEIDFDVQIHLAEVIKKSFSAIPISIKISAIPNRTNLGIKKDQKFYGLEDGGDIFSYPLDMRYVFEVNKNQTRDFFNDMLYRHLKSINAASIDELLKSEKTTKGKLINTFFANVALNEILIACAGVPRDFINLFLNSYDRFILTSNSSNTRVSVKNVRSANSAWYETDKKEQVNKHHIEKQLLESIVQEIIEKKKSIHFLIPDKYTSNKHIQNLIDFRVLHLRKSGYSHKDHPGVSYNVYSIDYGCYNSLNINKNSLDSSTLDTLGIKELRDIRRVSLEDSFFQKFLLSIGEAFNCPHCTRAVDTNHLAFLKQNLCNNCYERIDDELIPKTSQAKIAV
ncbi:ORC-CDC6 family AAA ATPase [Chromobacterium violaceum]|uniref:ORC-CDC6 family AAA ATPase n=1 Tax=Chromobacterium violaceum TaxID=536 RepID=UPI003DA86F67